MDKLDTIQGKLDMSQDMVCEVQPACHLSDEDCPGFVLART